ncbi:MAG: signal peptidase I [Ferruginibacter sp.]
MKKILILLSMICVAIVFALVAGSVTGALRLYHIPTITNEPAIKKGEYIMVSNIKTPQPFNFLVITSAYADSLQATYMPDTKPGSRFVYRLCGMPGDIVEMKNGILWVNNKNFDEELNLKNQFSISNADYAQIKEEDKEISEDQFLPAASADSTIVTFEKTVLKKYQHAVKFIPHIIKDTSSAFAWMRDRPYWTTDNFGPLAIPSDCYFVLGDNRHNAQDSRYIGFINKHDIKGVLLNK